MRRFTTFLHVLPFLMLVSVVIWVVSTTNSPHSHIIRNVIPPAVNELSQAPGPPITWQDAKHLQNEQQGPDYWAPNFVQLGQYWNLIRDSVIDFDRQMGVEPPRHIYFVPDGDMGPGCNELHVPQYCEDSDAIEIHASTMQDLYSLSWLAPAVFVAHESGHAQQRFYSGHKFDDEDSLHAEHQADCVAGVWASWMRSRGLVTDDDIRGLDQTFRFKADKDHGTYEQRKAAFQAGLDGGNFAACAPLSSLSITN